MTEAPSDPTLAKRARIAHLVELGQRSHREQDGCIRVVHDIIG